ncbi:MAG: RES family NAD+ phosphorylase [Defluviitaleaceae bacterium]|nr:RES family NAD+ phosphorylase [Defluviitaleaceae bacterium]
MRVFDYMDCVPNVKYHLEHFKNEPISFELSQPFDNLITEASFLGFLLKLRADKTNLYRARIYPKNDMEIEFITNRLSHVFQGYDKERSGAPGQNFAKNNRASREGERCLYAALDLITAVQEVRPILDEYVSVAKLKLMESNMIIFDLTRKLSNHLLVSIINHDPINQAMKELGVAINNEFMQPYRGSDKDYGFTQWFSDKVKNHRYQGIAYSSALHKGGSNLAIFSPDLWEPINSRLVKVSDIKYMIKTVKI